MTSRPLAVGDELVYSYGEKSSVELQALYGFSATGASVQMAGVPLRFPQQPQMDESAQAGAQVFSRGFGFSNLFQGVISRCSRLFSSFS